MDDEMLTDIGIGGHLIDIILNISDTEQNCKQGQKHLEIFGADIGTLEQNEQFRCLNSITVIQLMLKMATNPYYAGATKTMASRLCEVAPDLPVSFLCWMSRLLDSAEEEQLKETIDKVYECIVNHLVVHLSHNSPTLIWFASGLLNELKRESRSLSLDHCLTHDEDSPVMLWVRIENIVSSEPRHQHQKKLLCSKFLTTYTNTSLGGLFLRMQALITLAQAENELANYDAAVDIMATALEHWSDDLENLLPLRNCCQNRLQRIEDARLEESSASFPHVEDDSASIDTSSFDDEGPPVDSAL